MNDNDVVITGAARTAVGSFGGSLSSLTAPQLGAEVIKKVLEKSEIKHDQVDTVYMGQILAAGAGQNPARQAAIHAGIPVEKTATTINQLCGSGLASVAFGYNSIKCGDANIVIAGGQESMSNAPHFINIRNGLKLGDGKLQDSMIIDGLWDAYNHYHMGMTAENVAQKFQITRKDQDAFAAASQRKAIDAIKGKKFNDEIVSLTVKIKKQDVVFDKDEYPKDGTTIEKLEILKPAFKKDGTVTAGNASGLNDGAAVVLMMREKEALQRGLKPMARIASWATAGVAPEIMGTGPIPASQKALHKAGWKINDLDLIEANEAFAAQAIAVNQEMNWDPSIVNVNGGAIALGHPIGASGCRILVTLLHEMQRSNKSKGLATLCIGGGMGIALTVESFN